MKLKTIILYGLVGAQLILSGHVAHAADNGFKITATKTLDILAQIIDKKLSSPEGHIQLNADGKISGLMGGQMVTGEWSSKGDFYCRNITIGTKRTDTDCQIILNSPNGIIFHRHRGAGRKVGPYVVSQM
ncbi:MAG: hypothetical protein OCD03_08820 [Hyphomicrobiales bacterium]